MLKVPDRVPIEVLFGSFPVSYCSMTIQEVTYNPDKLLQAQLTTVLDFQRNMDMNPYGTRSFEASDIFKAKSILGDRICIRGNVRLSPLVTGESKDVKSYCRRLIDQCGKGGRFIMDSSENVWAMFEFTKEYSVY